MSSLGENMDDKGEVERERERKTVHSIDRTRQQVQEKMRPGAVCRAHAAVPCATTFLLTPHVANQQWIN